MSTRDRFSKAQCRSSDITCHYLSSCLYSRRSFLIIFFFFFLMIRPPPRSPLFPYTTLSRSVREGRRPGLRTASPPALPSLEEPVVPVMPMVVPVMMVVVMVMMVVVVPVSAADLCRSEEHTSELQSRLHLVCRLLLEKKKKMS